MFSQLCVAALFVATCYADVAPAAAPVLVNTICKQRNSYYKVDASCDSYVLCNEYEPTDMTCPDGLHFNPEAKWPEYPCGYPMDVPCAGRASLQSAQATADCPHQYGYFQSPAASEDNCGQYRLCIAGHAIEMTCPTGLAYNSATGRCDWPDLVSTCDAGRFLGFTCPAGPVDAYGNPLDVVINYKYDGNCYYFFTCEQGRARLLSCDVGLAFDPLSGRCVDEDFVECLVPAVPQSI